MAIKGAQPEHGRVTPHLIVRNTLQAVEFYRQALDAEVLYCAPLPDGTTTHAHLKIANSVVMVTEEAPGQAQTKGATPLMPPMDTFWGDRYGWVADPFGYIWALSTIKEVLTPEQVKERMEALFAQMKGGR